MRAFYGCWSNCVLAPIVKLIAAYRHIPASDIVVAFGVRIHLQTESAHHLPNLELDPRDLRICKRGRGQCPLIPTNTNKISSSVLTNRKLKADTQQVQDFVGQTFVEMKETIEAARDDVLEPRLFGTLVCI